MKSHQCNGALTTLQRLVALALLMAIHLSNALGARTNGEASGGNEKTHELAPHRFSAGERFLEQVTVSIDANHVMKTDEGEMKTPMRLSSKALELVDIVAVEEQRVSETLVDYLAGYTVTSTTAPGEHGVEIKTSFEESPLTGLQARYVERDGKWFGSVVSGESNPAIAGELEKYVSPEEGILPRRPVYPGETWTISGLRFRRFLGLASGEILKPNGNGELEYERVVQRKGTAHAVVRWRLEFDAVLIDVNHEECLTRWVIDGHSWIDLASGIEAEAQGSGSLVVENAFGDVSKPTRLVGNMTFRRTSRLLTSAGR